jgi:DNA-binding CsgD family transcriptional regulator
LWGPELIVAWLACHDASSAAGELSVVTDVHGRIVAVSVSATAVLGRDPHELVGQELEALWWGTLDAGRQARVERFGRMRRMAGTFPLPTAGGELADFEFESIADRPARGLDLTTFRRRVRERPSRALTERERAILGLACAGHSNEHIAATLGMSAGVVHNRRQSAYQKLQATGLDEACSLLGQRPAQG